MHPRPVEEREHERTQGLRIGRRNRQERERERGRKGGRKRERESGR